MTTEFEVSECKSEVEILKTHMQAYPVGQLGAWTWVLVRSDRWKDLGLDSASPAYTAIDDRLTLIDESMLVEKNAIRTQELMRNFELPLPQLVDFAVTHEMGHALCGFREEGKADAVGRRLREGKLPYCSIPVKTREKFPVKVQADVWGATQGNGGGGEQVRSMGRRDRPVLYTAKRRYPERRQQSLGTPQDLGI